MKGQVAFEYMIIIAVILAFIIPLWIYNISVQRDAGAELALAYSKNVAKKIADTANLVGSQGPPAKVSLQVFIPDGIVETNISSNRINLKVRIDGGVTDVFEISQVTLNGTLPTNKGNYILSIEAMTGYVQINPQLV